MKLFSKERHPFFHILLLFPAIVLIIATFKHFDFSALKAPAAKAILLLLVVVIFLLPLAWKKFSQKLENSYQWMGLIFCTLVTFLLLILTTPLLMKFLVGTGLSLLFPPFLLIFGFPFVLIITAWSMLITSLALKKYQYRLDLSFFAGCTYCIIQRQAIHSSAGTQNLLKWIVLFMILYILGIAINPVQKMFLRYSPILILFSNKKNKSETTIPQKQDEAKSANANLRKPQLPPTKREIPYTQTITPLLGAIITGDIALVQTALADQPEELNTAYAQNGNTPLHVAALNGYTDIVRLLLSQPGIDTTRTNNDGKTALDLARGKGFEEIAQLLENK